jgi:hypothetical protein
MTIQNYLVVESNVVTNDVVWDGNTETWTPPINATMLIQSTTPAIIWQAIVVDKVVTDWELVEVIGAGVIGFIWNGTVLTTNEPKPAIPTTT